MTSNKLKNRIRTIIEKGVFKWNMGKTTEAFYNETADKILTELQKETKQAIEKVRLEKKEIIDILEITTFQKWEDMANDKELSKLADQILADLEKKKKEVIKGLSK